VEDDAVRLVQTAHEVAHLGAQDAFHGALVRRDDMHLEAAFAQRGGDFESDEAGPHHDGAARGRRARDDRARVRQRPQGVDVRQVHAGDRQANRLGAGGQQEPVVGDLAAVAEFELARLRIDGDDAALQPQVDVLFGVVVLRTQRHPVLGRRAVEIVLGQVGTIDGRRVVLAEHHDAALVVLAPEHLGRGETGRTAAHDDHLSRRFASRPTGARRGLHLAEDQLTMAFPYRPKRGGRPLVILKPIMRETNVPPETIVKLDESLKRGIHAVKWIYGSSWDESRESEGRSRPMPLPRPTAPPPPPAWAAPAPARDKRPEPTPEKKKGWKPW
jgi:hypothetical protein